MVPEPEEIVEAILHFDEKVVEVWFAMNALKD
jgi:hypothetical protein